MQASAISPESSVLILLPTLYLKHLKDSRFIYWSQQKLCDYCHLKMWTILGVFSVGVVQAPRSLESSISHTSSNTALVGLDIVDVDTLVQVGVVRVKPSFFPHSKL